MYLHTHMDLCMAYVRTHMTDCILTVLIRMYEYMMRKCYV